MQPSRYILAIIMFMFIIVGGIAILNVYKDNGAAFVNDPRFAEFNNTFNKMDDVEAFTEDIRSTVEEEDADYGIIGQTFSIADSLINGLWNTLKLLTTSLSFMNGIYNGLESFFGIPDWVSIFIIMAVTVALVFSIIGALFQRDL